MNRTMMKNITQRLPLRKPSEFIASIILDIFLSLYKKILATIAQALQHKVRTYTKKSNNSTHDII